MAGGKAAVERTPRASLNRTLGGRDLWRKHVPRNPGRWWQSGAGLPIGGAVYRSLGRPLTPGGAITVCETRRKCQGGGVAEPEKAAACVPCFRL